MEYVMSVPERISSGFDGFRGVISGVSVLIAARNGTAEAVDVASIRDGLELSRSDSLWGYLLRDQFAATVSIDGYPRTTYLVSLEAFFKYCMLNPSSRLNSFRDQLAGVARDVQQRGSHISQNSGASAYLTSETENDPTSQMLAAMLQQRRETAQLGRQVAVVEQRVDSLSNQIGHGPSHWTVAAWIDYHGYKAALDVAKDEGLQLRRICLSRNIAIRQDKSCSGSSFSSRMWPMEAIRIWWPECCQRHGWILHWKQ
jgi:hypothetical protein